MPVMVIEFGRKYLIVVRQKREKNMQISKELNLRKKKYSKYNNNKVHI